MSLLLQALQKAAKNREAGTAPVELHTPVPERASAAPLEPPSAILPKAFLVETPQQSRPVETEITLAEDDLFEPEETLPEEPAQQFEPFGPSPAAVSPADAATILRAGETPSAGWMDYVRDRPVIAVLIGAAIFGAFYSIYVYLQIAHPGVLRGEFMSQPLAPKTPPTAPRPLPPAPKASAVTTKSQTAPAPSEAASKPGAPSAIETPAAPSGSPTALPDKSTSVPAVAAGPPSAEPRPSTKPIPPAASMKPAPASAAPLGARSARAAERGTAVAEGLVSPEQAVQPNAPGNRARRPAATPAVQFPALEHEISSTPAESAPGTVAPLIKDAYQALQDGKLDQAENLYRNALQTEGQNVDALLGLGAIAAQRGQAQQAIGFYERVLEAEPRNPAAQAGLISLIGQADPQMSESRLKQLIAREPSAFLYFSLGNLYSTQGQWPAAQQAYFQAFQLQPDNPDYAYNLAVGLEHLNQSKLALTYYRKAIDLSFKKGRANFDQKRVIERIGQLSARFD